jgi:hypothetical protein
LDRTEPDPQPFAARAISPVTPATDGSSNANLANQRRVSVVSDEINGGPGRTAQRLPSTVNRVAQLAGLPDGGITLGQQTPFPPPTTANTDFTSLPRVLDLGNQRQAADATDESNGGAVPATPQLPATVNRATQLAGLPDGGLTLGQRTPFPAPAGAVNTDAIGLPAVLRGIAWPPAQHPTNEPSGGWPQFAPLRQSPDDDLELPDFLRRALANIGQNAGHGRLP